MRVGLFGRGRLGGAIASAAGGNLAWQVAREAPPTGTVDVAVEASSGAAVPMRLQWALATHTPLVIGSTGWDPTGLDAATAGRIPVVLAPNFSLTVALLRRLAVVFGRFAAEDTQRDPYLIEHHHARKLDAPSGTARLLAEALVAACPWKSGWAVGGPLGPEQLSVGVVRAGTTYSSHTVGIDSPDEVLELTHTSRSAGAYAAGALAAARFAVQCHARGRSGVITFDEVAAAALDPLFRGLAGEVTG